MYTFRNLVLLCSAISLLPHIKGVIIRTPQGAVDGKIQKVPGYGEVTKFLGIPYAEPPIGRLRLASPEKAKNFTGTYDATYGRPLCPQPEAYLPLLNLTKDPDVIFRIDEDCLYLNVYIPGSVRRGTLFPVMVWLHGGSWQWGSATHYDARKLAAMGKVVVVTVNYRLGILGFLPDGSKRSTLGLQDQIEALKWVRMNIWSYGGDPGMVTIFGESAGGASVSFLCSSPPAKGLFYRAISQSGLKNSAWAFDDTKWMEKMNAIDMKLRRSGCNKRTVFDCLYSASVTELVDLTQFVMSSLRLPAWTPHVDNYVIMSDVLDNTTLIHPGVQRLIGFNTDEGGAMIEYICIHDTGSPCRLYEGISFQSVRKWIAPEMDLYTFEKIGRKYMTWYPGPRKISRMSLRAASAFTTDWFERFPTNRTATTWRDIGRKVFVYEMKAKPKGFDDFYSPVPWSDDAQHTEELPFVFAAVGKEDSRLAQRIVTKWTKFAAGDDGDIWPDYGKHANFILLNKNGSDAVLSLRQPLISHRKEEFWKPWFTEGEFPDAERMNSSAARIPIKLTFIFIFGTLYNLLNH